MTKKTKNQNVEVPGASLIAEAGDVGVQKRHRSPDRANFEFQVTEGDDWSADLGRFSYKLQVINRIHDWYIELVVDKQTGEILRQCSEPLSAHRQRK